MSRDPRAEASSVAVHNSPTLEKLDRHDDRPVLISLAVRFGKTRLIDNILLNRARTGKTGALVMP